MRAKALAAIVGSIVLSVALMAGAEDTVRCEVLTIEASNAGQGIDPALRAHSAIFGKPPLSAFNSFKLVQRRAYDVTLGTPAALVLPQPFTGSLSFNGATQGKLDLTLKLARQQAQPILINGKASPGTPFFAAGFRSATGTWIFGVLCERNGVIVH
jgi:hypothetical protein